MKTQIRDVWTTKKIQDEDPFSVLVVSEEINGVVRAIPIETSIDSEKLVVDDEGTEHGVRVFEMGEIINMWRFGDGLIPVMVLATWGEVMYSAAYAWLEYPVSTKQLYKKLGELDGGFVDIVELVRKKEEISTTAITKRGQEVALERAKTLCYLADKERKENENH